MKIDTSDITANLDFEMGEVDRMVLDTTTKLTLDVQTALKLRTPKDTGRAANGWDAILPSNPYGEGAIENAVPYIEPLNAGHSKQAPPGEASRVFRRQFELGHATISRVSLAA